MAERIAAETPGASTSTSSTIRPIRWPTKRRPARKFGEQTGHEVDAVVCGVGSGGTITGLSRFFARVAPQVEMVLADPAGSVLADYRRDRPDRPGGLVGGRGDRRGFRAADRRSLAGPRRLHGSPTPKACSTARELLRSEGILAGSSTGTLVAAALRYCREQSQPKRVVTLVCDSGNKYLSKMFNDFWMADRGFSERSAPTATCAM